MKHLLLTLLLATLCATGYGQTIKSLGYNASSGEVVYAGTNVLTFTNAVVTFNGVTSEGFSFDGGANFDLANGELQFSGNDIYSVGSGTSFDVFVPIGFAGDEAATNAAITRTNLGLGATNDVEFYRGTFNSAVEILEGTNAAVVLNPDSPSQFKEGISVLSAFGISFDGTNAPAARVSTMRALAGSTNTNQPHSGNLDVVGQLGNFTIVVSNGIIIDVTQ